MKLFYAIGRYLYFLSYPFWWAISLPVFVIFGIGKSPVVSWLLAVLFWYAHSVMGFRSAIPIPYTSIVIETGEPNALLFLIAALVVMPFFARKVYDSLFHSGIWSFIKDPLNLKPKKPRKAKKAAPAIPPVKIVVPFVKAESIGHAVKRLQPHLQRLISGVDREKQQKSHAEKVA